MEIRLEHTPATGGTGHPGRQFLRQGLSSTPYRRRPPLFLFDPHATNLGAGVQSGARVRRVAPSFRTVRNARLVGQRLVVDRTGEIVLDEVFPTEADTVRQMQRFCNRASSLHHEDADVEERNGRFFSSRLARCDKRIDGPTLSLLSGEPSNFGSWFFRILPKLAFLQQLGGQKVAVACWCPAKWQRNLLHFFGISDDQIIDINLSVTYEFEELHVPVCLNPNAFLSEESLDLFANALERNKIRQTRDRLVYLSRLSHARARKFANVRYFVNELELVERLAAAGFDIVEPEKHSISDQAAIFANARLVVGASGAGMFNTAFCPIGTGILDIEAFPNWLYAHCNYFASCGHAYALAFGVVDPTDTTPGSHKRWTMDTQSLANKIDAFRNIL